MSPKIFFVLGTRPEIIKLSPIIRLCEQVEVPFSIIHTGQHYSRSLDEVFFEQLYLPPPDYNLDIGSDSHGAQTGEMTKDIEAILQDLESTIVLVQGDTNSVLAGAIATSKLPNAELGHVEAGLRSYNRDMPEETNRRVSDHVSDYLFAPTKTAKSNLLAEDIPTGRISVTGNTIVDAVHQHEQIAREESTILTDLNCGDRFSLLTAHRAENVDDRSRFVSLLEGVAETARAHELSVIYPVHPRAENRLQEFDIEVPPEIETIKPLDFLDFLTLEKEAKIVFTDSGGVQEETCILHTPCVTLRDETERPETVEVGANRIAGIGPRAIVKAAEEMVNVKQEWKNPFGDGYAAERILQNLGFTI